MTFIASGTFQVQQIVVTGTDLVFRAVKSCYFLGCNFLTDSFVRERRTLKRPSLKLFPMVSAMAVMPRPSGTDFFGKEKDNDQPSKCLLSFSFARRVSGFSWIKWVFVRYVVRYVCAESFQLCLNGSAMYKSLVAANGVQVWTSATVVISLLFLNSTKLFEAFPQFFLKKQRGFHSSRHLPCAKPLRLSPAPCFRRRFLSRHEG